MTLPSATRTRRTCPKVSTPWVTAVLDFASIRGGSCIDQGQQTAIRRERDGGGETHVFDEKSSLSRRRLPQIQFSIPCHHSLFGHHPAAAGDDGEGAPVRREGHSEWAARSLADGGQGFSVDGVPAHDVRMRSTNGT